MEGRGWRVGGRGGKGAGRRNGGQQEADLRAQSTLLEPWRGQRPGGKSRFRHLDSEIVIF